ncbi:MAG: N-acetyltransferase [Methanomicrobiales archaeon HGW-Methanomicrobiales-3]|jgi:RimJ/RimL family protein N-acetyltransferase|nr:MAG: N-acetyltransferase [Methanomicrobiales archaeon HGW-Methanomicrobiales-3]
MLRNLPVSTVRLELVPATLPILTCDLHHDAAGLGRLLNATVPAGWPPPLLDDDALAHFISLVSGGSDPFFCSWYWIRCGVGDTDRVLIGSGGIATMEGSDDTVMIGYSVLDEFQNHGYATEAVRHLIPAIFSDPAIRRIAATTYPELKASIRVLEKCGFLPAGPAYGGAGMEEGTVMLVLERDATE